MAVDGDTNATQRGRNVRFEQVASYDDGTVLVVTFVGGPAGDIFTEPCANDYEVEAVETNETIEIRVHELGPVDRSRLPREYSCNSAGFSWVVDVPLNAPAGERELVGSDVGQLTIPAIEDLWVPTWLPDDWVWESADLVPPQVSARYSYEGQRITVWAGPVVTMWSEREEVQRVSGAEQLPGVPGGWIAVKKNDANSATFASHNWEYSIRTPPGTSKELLESFIAGMRHPRELDDQPATAIPIAPKRDTGAVETVRTNAPTGSIFRNHG